MPEKLTLRMEKELIERAKNYASKKGTSVSKLVADYFQAIDSDQNSMGVELPPVTQTLSGILKGKSTSEEDYRVHLSDKYLQ